VLSNLDYNSNNQDILVAAITSNLEQKEYTITITSADLDEGDLKYESVIRADKIYSLSQTIVLKKFGAVKKEVMQLTNSEVVPFDDESGWSPFLRLEDAHRLDEAKEALRQNDIETASNYGKIYELRQVANV
jgi:mRNA interferase MazF